ncbi:MAG: S-formylglutathione hydrolase [Marinovum sp.]|nr:S-formylglutathione hydrolase [Marinovum sp.]
MDIQADNRCFGGRQLVITHASESCACDMTFGLFLPAEAETGPVPVLWYLSGLTCTHENAMVKAGAQAHAAAHGMALVFPDTSPRGGDVADDAAYDLGKGAGFYVNATQDPWAPHFQMKSYVLDELPALLMKGYPLDAKRQGITGHSMGGHGALTLAMSAEGRFSSVSAFAPICNPTGSDWGRKQLSAYLGDEESTWQVYDASVMINSGAALPPVLIDTGVDDQFGDLLKTEVLAQALTAQRIESQLRLQAGYDHSYFFVSTFTGDHIAFHASHMGA